MKSNIVKKSVFAVILCLVLLFSVRIVPCQTTKANREKCSVGQDIQPYQIVFDWLKTQYDPTFRAEDKIKATVNTYFILKYESWKNGRFVDFAYLFNQTDNISWSSYTYERDLLSVLLLNWEYYNSLLKSYDYRPELSGLIIENDHAFIRAWPHAYIIHRNTPSRIDESPWSIHEMSMSCQNGLWLIQRDVSKEEIAESYPLGTDFISLRKTFFERIKWAEIADKEMALAMRNNRTTSDREYLQNLNPRSTSYRTWDNTKCRNYALTYSSNEPGSGSYNQRFICYDGADCQNFVSQCIWYSFGGIDEIESIESHALPMIDNSIPARTWWCDSVETSTYSSNPIKYYWINVLDFNSMVTWNYSHDAVGLQCSKGNLNGLMIGDYVKYKNGSHVFIISSIIEADHDYDVDFNEIYICAHTNNHWDIRLVDIGVNPTDVDLMWVRRFKNPNS